MSPDSGVPGQIATTNNQSPTRVLRIIARLNVGGPARHVVWLTAALQPPRFESVLIAGSVPAGEDDMSEFALESGVQPVVIPELSRELSTRDLIVILKLFRLFRKYRPDIVHTHTAKAGAVGRIATFIYNWTRPISLIRPMKRTKLVHTYHGHVFHSYYGKIKTSIFLTIERILAMITDRIVVLSEQQLTEVRDHFNIGRRDSFRIVPLGIEFGFATASKEAGAALRRQLGIRADEKVVGIVGRLAEVKNHELFLRVANQFRTGSDRPVRFVVFGDGQLRAAIERRIRELDMENVVLLAGTCEPAAIYGATDAVVLTSLNEGTPLALIEAMANGIPVVSTAVGGVVDVLGPVSQNVNTGNGTYAIRARGFSAASGDADGLTAALARLFADGELVGRMGQRGRDHVRAKYSKDRLTADIVSLYDGLL